jgi:hypothetical protein
MMRSGITNSSHPFPHIPDSLKSKYGAGELVIRPFGKNAADIEIDFQHPFRPFLVTQLLRCCTQKGNGENIAEGFFWDLTVSKRIEALFSIVTSTFSKTAGNPELVLQLHCLKENCNELMETGITQEEVLAVQSSEPVEGSEIFPIPVNGKEYFFRKPTGRDQLQWLKSSFPDERTAAEAMIQTLRAHPGKNRGEAEPPFTHEWMEAVNEGMKTVDPLVHFELTIYCPVCNHENHYVPDLEELLIGKLHKVQLDLLHTIHRLASHYHWSEQQILGISPHRRAYYLSLIEGNEKSMLR